MRLASTGTATKFTTRNSDTNRATEARTAGTEIAAPTRITAAVATSMRRGHARGPATGSCASRRWRSSALNTGDGSARNARSQASWLVSFVLTSAVAMGVSLPLLAQAFDRAVQDGADVGFAQPGGVRNGAVRHVGAVLHRDQLALSWLQRPEQRRKPFGVRLAQRVLFRRVVG